MQKRVEFTEAPEGLVVTLREPGRACLHRERTAHGWSRGTAGIFRELCEWQFGNGWSEIKPEVLGALRAPREHGGSRGASVRPGLRSRPERGLGGAFYRPRREDPAAVPGGRTRGAADSSVCTWAHHTSAQFVRLCGCRRSCSYRLVRQPDAVRVDFHDNPIAYNHKWRMQGAMTQDGHAMGEQDSCGDCGGIA
jgi:hypothetical protein